MELEGTKNHLDMASRLVLVDTASLIPRSPCCVSTAAHLVVAQGDFGLSLTQDGYLPAAFLVSFISCP